MRTRCWRPEIRVLAVATEPRNEGWDGYQVKGPSGPFTAAQMAITPSTYAVTSTGIAIPKLGTTLGNGDEITRARQADTASWC